MGILFDINCFLFNFECDKVIRRGKFIRIIPTQNSWCAIKNLGLMNFSPVKILIKLMIFSRIKIKNKNAKPPKIFKITSLSWITFT